MTAFLSPLKKLAFRMWRRMARRFIAHEVKPMQVKADRKLRYLRNEVERFKVSVLHAEKYAYGSMTPGNLEWDARWREDRPRVVLFATQDYGGSFYQWVSALNRHTPWAARLVVIMPHRFGYPNDLVYGAAENVSPGVFELLDDADVFHVKDEAGFFTGQNRLGMEFLQGIGIPRIANLYGSQARRRQDDQAFRSHINAFDATVSLTPDLCFEWLRRPFYVPAAVDLADIPETWADSQTVAHAPSNPALKGTEYFLEAVQAITSAPDLDVDLITDVSHADALRRVSRAGMFFDQAGNDTISGKVIGWYGNAALEAASRGVPTIAHLSAAALEGSERGGYPARSKMAVLNTGQASASLRQVMTEYFALTHEDRMALSKRTRNWAGEFHGAEGIGNRLASLYNELAGRN